MNPHKTWNDSHVELIRENSHLSQKELCELTGLSLAVVNNIKNQYKIYQYPPFNKSQKKAMEILAKEMLPNEISEALSIPFTRVYYYLHFKCGKRFVDKNAKG